MKLAIVFPGQGSQAVGMLAEIASSYPVVRDVFNQASEVLGYDLWQLAQDGPTAELNKTEITQPVMLSAGVACYRIFQDKVDKDVAVLAGHSLGEYSALVAADALEFDAALRLVEQRGKFMQAAVPPDKGAMAAILGLTDDEVKNICTEVTGIVEAVNFNSPGQVVIAGEKPAVENACALAKKRGAKRAIMLPVSVPSHSSLMREAAEQYSMEINKVRLNRPKIPMINNVDVKAEIEPDLIRYALLRQIYSPVRWTETIINMRKTGVSHIVESGPGKVLTGLCKRIDRELEVFAMHDLKAMDVLLKEIK